MGDIQTDIAELKKQDDNITFLLSEMRQDLKDVKMSIQQIRVLELENSYNKEAMQRAFQRIEKLEKNNEDVAIYINQLKGALKFAWVLWGIMSSALFVIIFKLFFGLN